MTYNEYISISDIIERAYISHVTSGTEEEDEV